MPLESINPTTGLFEKVFDEHSETEVERALVLSQEAYSSWRLLGYDDRAWYFQKIADLLRSQKLSLAKLMAREMGKVVTAGIGEVEKCAQVCDYYAMHTEQLLAQEQVETEARKSYVRFDAIGAILAVMPWNFPFWQVFRFAAPTLMAGNVGLLKHASSVPQCAQEIQRLFGEAGFPEGVFQNLMIGSSRVEALIADKRIAAVTLTGSEGAGSKVAQAAGKALKKTVLELGGSDPFIVLADADIERAAVMSAAARLQNCGQSCIAAKRFIIVDAVYEKFIAAMKKEFEQIVIGDPLENETQLGPLASAHMFSDIARQVKESIAFGARLVTGGRQKGTVGFFYEPTILADVTPGMPAYGEELFGPVAAVMRAQDDQDAVRMANDTPYGLGASVWSADLKKAEEIAGQINSGSVFVNAIVKSDPRLPFGGIKLSGYGRELSHYGLKEFVNIKTIVIEDELKT